MEILNAPDTKLFPLRMCAQIYYTIYAHLYVLCTYMQQESDKPPSNKPTNTIKNSHSCMMRSAITVGIVFGSLKQVFSLMGWSRSKNSQAQKTYFENQYTVSVSMGRKMIYIFRKKDHNFLKRPVPFFLNESLRMSDLGPYTKRV